MERPRPDNTDRSSCGVPGRSRLLLALWLFGSAFGYVEAAVVADLRAIYEPIRARYFPESPTGELFPMVRLDQLEAEGELPVRLLKIELIREAATLVMLGALALAVARSVRGWLAAFVVAFGVWDLVYYLSLKWMLDWPASLLTWDLLFLLPVPWAGPVLAPALVSIVMIAGGSLVLWREGTNRPIRPGPGSWSAILGGGLIVVLAFCWDFRNTMAGGWPNPFRWDLFTLGLGTGCLGFVMALRETPRSKGSEARWPVGSTGRSREYRSRRPGG